MSKNAILTIVLGLIISSGARAQQIAQEFEELEGVPTNYYEENIEDGVRNDRHRESTGRSAPFQSVHEKKPNLRKVEQEYRRLKDMTQGRMDENSLLQICILDLKDLKKKYPNEHPEKLQKRVLACKLMEKAKKNAKNGRVFKSLPGNTQSVEPSAPVLPGDTEPLEGGTPAL